MRGFFIKSILTFVGMYVIIYLMTIVGEIRKTNY